MRFTRKIHIHGTPAYRARFGYKAKQQNKQLEIIEVINDNNEDWHTEITVHKNENLLIWKFIDQSQLWLNHKFVDTGMGLLKSAYPQVQGMQDCIMSDTLNFQSVKGNFVQISNCARNHWICVST